MEKLVSGEFTFYYNGVRTIVVRNRMRSVVTFILVSPNSGESAFLDAVCSWLLTIGVRR